MSARKRPLAEIAQAHSTPARYATTTSTTPNSYHKSQQQQQQQQHTPHYKLASTNVALSRLTRSAQRHTANTTQRRKVSLNTVRPDGSARNILRQFAKLTAPLTKKRVITPVAIHRHLGGEDDKENRILRGDEDREDEDSGVFKRMKFMIDVDEDENSEVLVPPTPSVLPDDDDDDEDLEQPTITFQRLHDARDAKERSMGKRRSGVSTTGYIDGGQDEGEYDNEEKGEGDITIMTERGRRALSEDATGRFSRYSLGFEGFNMSAFGSEPEFRRDSDRMTMDLMKTGYNARDYETSMILYGGDDDSMELRDEAHELGSTISSPVQSARGEETLQIPIPEEETFKIPTHDISADEQEIKTHDQHAHARSAGVKRPMEADREPVSRSIIESNPSSSGAKATASKVSSAVQHRHSLLEAATATARTTRARRQKMTQEGVLIPSFPPSLIKKIVLDSHAHLKKRPPKLGRDHMDALEQATEWFFEQIGEDLTAYSSHGKRRKRVSEDDVFLLMRRQRLMQNPGELVNLARQWLPKEMLKDLELPDEL